MMGLLFRILVRDRSECYRRLLGRGGTQVPTFGVLRLGWLLFRGAHNLSRMEVLKVAIDKRAWMNSINLDQMYSFIY